jgi:hypothetical protein
LFTGHVSPQAETTMSRAAMPWPRAVEGTISREAAGRRGRGASGAILPRADRRVKADPLGAAMVRSRPERTRPREDTP